MIKTFLVQAFYIPSGSMRDTLRSTTGSWCEKLSYWFGDVERGDIVVFDDPANWLGEEDGRVVRQRRHQGAVRDRALSRPAATW